ncbi:hypothetical protein SM124_16505 [Bacillus sp. 31A1R]|uniref:Uncharacterized protein n=1 Tax=Robertmurraya mangrovi TaxID=3098077 RepID=A0ABU5J1T8_9BACI|nr:hypothetical protein [Bacillus sp. 31A1R]MDZ5473321.1 hypothetical protein [Bacillus sp. 31A1R]
MDSIINHQLTHFIVTNAHDTTSRDFIFQETYEMITEMIGPHD